MTLLLLDQLIRLHPSEYEFLKFSARKGLCRKAYLKQISNERWEQF